MTRVNTWANDGGLEDRVWSGILANKLLSACSEKERTIVLEYLQGATHAEIAENIGTSKGRVGQIIQRSIYRMRRRAYGYGFRSFPEQKPRWTATNGIPSWHPVAPPLKRFGQYDNTPRPVDPDYMDSRVRAIDASPDALAAAWTANLQPHSRTWGDGGGGC